jgi:hypothetical protein
MPEHRALIAIPRAVANIHAQPLRDVAEPHERAEAVGTASRELEVDEVIAAHDGRPSVHVRDGRVEPMHERCERDDHCARVIVAVQIEEDTVATRGNLGGPGGCARDDQNDERDHSADAHLRHLRARWWGVLR